MSAPCLSPRSVSECVLLASLRHEPHQLVLGGQAVLFHKAFTPEFLERPPDAQRLKADSRDEFVLAELGSASALERESNHRRPHALNGVLIGLDVLVHGYLSTALATIASLTSSPASMACHRRS